LTSWLSSTGTSEVVSATHRIDDFLPIAGGFVIDFLVVSALIRLESSSVRAAASKSDKTNDFKIGWWIGVV
jgi:hypothetical protein